MNTKYGYGKNVNASFDQAVERVTQPLQRKGFGALTDIDVAGNPETEARRGYAALPRPGGSPRRLRRSP